ncbi:MAG: hypothetical protein AAFY46_04335 [Planctomycetota bacterium]
MLGHTIDRLGVAVAVAITATGYFGGIRPVVAHETSRLLTEREIESKTSQFDELRADLAAVDMRVQALEDRVGAFRSRFQASGRANERIGELAELAALHGVSVGSIRPGPVADGEGFRAQPVAISGSGEPGDLARFLASLREVFPDMGARNFIVSGQSAETSTLSAELIWFTGSADDAGAAAAATQ